MASWAPPVMHTPSTSCEAASAAAIPTTPFPAASLLPKQETEALAFMTKFPESDGRGVVVAVFDTGVDPAADGFQVTTDGKPKVLDVVDCTGAGDVDTTHVAKLAEGSLEVTGLTGRTLKLNTAWKIPNGEVRLGVKRLFDILPEPLVKRLQSERATEWENKQNTLLTRARVALNDFEASLQQPANGESKDAPPCQASSPQEQALRRAELTQRLALLKELQSQYKDLGPVYDVVTFFDGQHWRAAVDVSEEGNLTQAEAYTNFRTERKYGRFFAEADQMSYAINIFDEGRVTNIVTTCGSHGSHVAGIIGAHYPNDPSLNGVAPGCQIISVKIGDDRLDSTETNNALVRGLYYAANSGAHMINLSYGEPARVFGSGRFHDILAKLVEEKNILFIAAAGNCGPALSTLGAPVTISRHILAIGAYLAPSFADSAHSYLDGIVETPYSWTSRGPALDNSTGITVCAPGGAYAAVPTWCLQNRQLMEGTSMASPNACGGIALLLSRLLARGMPYSHARIRRAIENTARSVNRGTPLDYGSGLLQVCRAFDYLDKFQALPDEDVDFRVMVPDGGAMARGIYLREPHDTLHNRQLAVQIRPHVRNENGNVSSNNRVRIDLEQKLLLSATASWIQCPGHLFLTHGGRGFETRVACAQLEPGRVHYGEIHAFDSAHPERGPLFRVPVTVVMPMPVPEVAPGLPQTGVLPATTVTFAPGDVHRHFIRVPDGATYVDVILRGNNAEESTRYFVQMMQRLPNMHHLNTMLRKFMIIGSEQETRISRAVAPGHTLELALSHYWTSTGRSSLTYEVRFHSVALLAAGSGIASDRNIAGGATLNISPAEHFARVDVASALVPERALALSASFGTVRQSLRPVSRKVAALGERERVWDAKQVFALTVEYALKVSAEQAGLGAVITFPGFYDMLYDLPVESRQCYVYDSQKQKVQYSDAHTPTPVSLAEGSYVVQLCVSHDKLDLLEKFNEFLCQVDFRLKEPVSVSVFNSPDKAMTGEGAIRTLDLVPRRRTPLYVRAPALSALPKAASPGDLLIGKCSIGPTGNEDAATVVELSYAVPPTVTPTPDALEEQLSRGKPADPATEANKKMVDLYKSVLEGELKLLAHFRAEKDWAKFDALIKTMETAYQSLDDALHFFTIKLKLAQADAVVARGGDAPDYKKLLADAGEILALFDVPALELFRARRKNGDLKPTAVDAEADKALTAIHALYVDVLLLQAEALSKLGDDKDTLQALEQTLARLDQATTAKDNKKYADKLVHFENVARNRPAMAFSLFSQSTGKFRAGQNEFNLPKDSYQTRIELLEKLGWDLWVNYFKAIKTVRYPPAYELF
ncbi:hypothetical protein H696_05982 [Fonticula alba]|uniref:tripeptidyl-peptidase II n=1 Tax=Fonticula alba TaxID=691883 RepID=A0A058Z021_FONAL|nr:hypothetical protein H696_05982 [Fonticula alba]KCV67585.1 hypothetical protein H696_05982 [Fonticula alba]|eukprot:XP_009498026.1 hypothetical protein H696_05982 [Fonticula alba]